MQEKKISGGMVKGRVVLTILAAIAMGFAGHSLVNGYWVVAFSLIFCGVVYAAIGWAGLCASEEGEETGDVD